MKTLSSLFPEGREEVYEGAESEGGRDDPGQQVFSLLPGGAVFTHLSQYPLASLSSSGEEQ